MGSRRAGLIQRSYIEFFTRFPAMPGLTGLSWVEIKQEAVPVFFSNGHCHLLVGLQLRVRESTFSRQLIFRSEPPSKGARGHSGRDSKHLAKVTLATKAHLLADLCDGCVSAR